MAELLGVHRSSVYRMLETGQLPVDRFMVGREIRLSHRQVHAWLEFGDSCRYERAVPELGQKSSEVEARAYR